MTHILIVLALLAGYALFLLVRPDEDMPVVPRVGRERAAAARTARAAAAPASGSASAPASSTAAPPRRTATPAPARRPADEDPRSRPAEAAAWCCSSASRCSRPTAAVSAPRSPPSSSPWWSPSSWRWPGSARTWCTGRGGKCGRTSVRSCTRRRLVHDQSSALPAAAPPALEQPAVRLHPDQLAELAEILRRSQRPE